MMQSGGEGGGGAAPAGRGFPAAGGHPEPDSSAGAAAVRNSIVLWRSTTRAPRAVRAGYDAASRAAATDDPRPGARRVDDEAAQEDDEQAQGVMEYITAVELRLQIVGYSVNCTLLLCAAG